MVHFLALLIVVGLVIFVISVMRLWPLVLAAGVIAALFGVWFLAMAP